MALRWPGHRTASGVETSTCVVELDEQMFYARLDTGLVDVRPGDQVDIGIVVDKTTCYDEDGDLVREWCATETAEGVGDERRDHRQSRRARPGAA